MKRNLRCTCEQRAQLLPAQLEQGLPGLRCPACAGELLALEDWRRWRDTAPAVTAPLDAAVRTDGGARRCVQCDRLMQRLRVGSQPDFRVDRCAGCRLVWFDAGEWAALLSAGLATRLEDVLSDAGQRQLQADESRQRREQVLRAKHGDACIDELARVRQWLAGQPHPDELIALLRAGW